MRKMYPKVRPNITTREAQTAFAFADDVEAGGQSTFDDSDIFSH